MSRYQDVPQSGGYDQSYGNSYGNGAGGNGGYGGGGNGYGGGYSDEPSRAANNNACMSISIVS